MVLAFAHRGGADVGWENTLTAFGHAYDHLGYRHLETDVHASADGVVYAVHDPTLDRLVGEAVRVDRLSSAEVEKRRIGGREPIPRLETLLSSFPDATFNIDVKADSVVEPAAALLQRMSAVGRVCITSFSHRRLNRVRQLLPAVATAASPREIAQARSGLPVPAAPSFFQVPISYGPVTIVRPSFIERVHRANAAVHVWTIDDSATMEHLLDLGVDGIMTDRTELLRTVLLRRGVWEES